MSFHPSVAALGLRTPYDDVIAEQAGGDVSRITLIKGIIAAESSWDPFAVNPSDPSYGLMQLTLPTARQYLPTVQPIDLTDDPWLNITLGGSFLRDLLRTRAPHDAVAYYNAGCPTPKVSGLSGCPLRNAVGQYVNSYGSTAVQAYVDSVITYQVYYMNHLPAELSGNGWSVSPDPTPTVLGEVTASLGGVVDSITHFVFGPDSLAGDEGAVTIEAESPLGDLLGGSGAMVAAGLLVGVALLWPKGARVWTR